MKRILRHDEFDEAYDLDVILDKISTSGRGCLTPGDEACLKDAASGGADLKDAVTAFEESIRNNYRNKSEMDELIRREGGEMTPTKKSHLDRTFTGWKESSRLKRVLTDTYGMTSDEVERVVMGVLHEGKPLENIDESNGQDFRFHIGDSVIVKSHHAVGGDSWGCTRYFDRLTATVVSISKSEPHKRYTVRFADAEYVRMDPRGRGELHRGPSSLDSPDRRHYNLPEVNLEPAVPVYKARRHHPRT